jgi:hypothetical protein
MCAVVNGNPTSSDLAQRSLQKFVDAAAVEVNSTLGWDTGDEALGATRSSESDHSQTLPAAPQAAAAREAAGWAQLQIGPTSDLREGWDRGRTPTHSQKGHEEAAAS